jgi:hypothetical protein
LGDEEVREEEVDGGQWWGKLLPPKTKSMGMELQVLSAAEENGRNSGSSTEKQI